MRLDLGRSLASGAVILLFLATPAIGEDLKVASAGPEGEIARLEEAKEIRVVFSEPMVALGRIPEKVEASAKKRPRRKNASRQEEKGQSAGAAGERFHRLIDRSPSSRRS